MTIKATLKFDPRFSSKKTNSNTFMAKLIFIAHAFNNNYIEWNVFQVYEG